MIVLLPPSETKRSGGRRVRDWLDRLACPELAEQRALVLAALSQLSTDHDAAVRVLGLGKTQHDQVVLNRDLPTGPVLPAVDRYTGVLYDALDAGTLDTSARGWLRRNVMIHTAALGIVGALDGIPNYRLGAAANLPGLPPLRQVWASPVSSALASGVLPSAGFVLDLRSEAYVALGPVPDAVASGYVRVVTRGPDGATRALNHFNKHTKGALVRHLAQDRPRIGSRAGFLRWAQRAGWDVQNNAHGELELVIRE